MFEKNLFDQEVKKENPSTNNGPIKNEDLENKPIANEVIKNPSMNNGLIKNEPAKDETIKNDKTNDIDTKDIQKDNKVEDKKDIADNKAEQNKPAPGNPFNKPKVDFFEQNKIEQGSERERFYNFILFFECHRAIMEYSFLEFYTLMFERYPHYHLYGSRAAFLDGIEVELEKLAERELKTISKEDINKLIPGIVQRSKLITRLVFINCDKDINDAELEDYAEIFKKWHHEINNKLSE